VLISFSKNWNLLIVNYLFIYFNFLQLWLNQYQVEFWFKCNFLVSELCIGFGEMQIKWYIKVGKCSFPIRF
jgi:hypothetical protein